MSNDAVRMPKTICVAAQEAALAIANYCTTRFQAPGVEPVFPMLDVPWFAEKVQKAMDEGAAENAELRRELQRLIDVAGERLAALQAADAVMTAADSRLDLGNQLGDGPMQVWVDAHRQVRAALEKARGATHGQP